MFERKNSKQERKSERKPEPEAPRVQEQRDRSPQSAPSSAAAIPAASESKVPATSQRSRAMIGSKVKIKGDVISGEDLLVEGEVSGSITLADNELVVGTSGRVEANITAKTIRIEGEVKGDVEGTERVVICASGQVQGNVSAPRVMLEDGGRFKGSIDMGGPSASESGIGSGSVSGSASGSAGKPKNTGMSDVHSIDKTG